jgi:hypothetical protein
MEYKEYENPEDIFKDPEFKELKWYRRFWVRLVIAFYQTISML